MRASLTRSSNVRSLAMSIPAGIAFFFLQRANLLADIPIWVILIVLWVSFLVGVVATTRWPDTTDARQLQYRMAVQAAGTTATIYATAWAPMLRVAANA